MTGVQRHRPNRPQRGNDFQEDREKNTLYIRIGCDDYYSRKFIMYALTDRKPLYITPWRKTWNGATEYIFVKFQSISTAMEIKQNFMYSTDAHIEFARKQKKNNFLPEISNEKEEQKSQIPQFVGKDEFIIFKPISQNFRLRKVRMADKDTYISREVVGSKYNKQADDNLIFDNLKVALSHAMILNLKNGVKSQFFLQNLSDSVTLVNKAKLEKGEKYPLKSGDIIQFGEQECDTNRKKVVSPIRAELEIIEKRFRPVVIDGCNICHGFRNDAKQFHLDGLQSVYDCFKKLGYEDKQIHIIMKPPPKHVKTSNYDQVIKEFQDKDILHFTPARFTGPQNRLTVSHDDLFILNTAKQLNGIVLSKDQYRKEKASHPEYAEVISNRLLQPSFIGGLCILPDDPLGNNGPSLRTFLELS